MNKKIEMKKLARGKAKIVLTETKEVDVTMAEDKQDMIRQIDNELLVIVHQVKSLKKRADELKQIKEMLMNEK